MKIVGWIFIIIGGVALLGTIISGNSAFGPLFWLGLGITLLYFSSKRSNKDNETDENI